jgi:PKD repeat protein
VFAKPGTYTATLTVTDRAGRVTTTKTAITVGDLVRPVGPVRDAAVTVAGHATLRLKTTQLHITSNADRAALVTITVTGSKSAGYVTVYADGTSRPGQAAVEFGAGRQASDLALATFGKSGYADFYNGSSSPISLVINTVGAEGTVTTAAETYTPVTPASVLPATNLAGNHYLAFTVAGKDGVPANASAVAVDITASGGTAAGHFVTYPERTSADQQQGAYWSTRQQATGLAVVQVNGRVGLKNVGSGTATFSAQVVGYYSAASSAGSIFLPSPRARVLDVSVAARHSVKLQVTGKNGIPAAGTTAVSVNVTATGASAPGTLTAYADGTTRPALTSLSYVTGITAVNAAIVAVGTDGAIDLYNNGTKPVTIVVDLTGSYYAYPR